VAVPAFAIVAIGTSAGGLRALETVLGALPDGFPVPVVIVQHLDPRHRSLMADILTRHTVLPVKQAESGERLRPGTVYVAPPDHHLLVNLDGTLALTQSELVRFVRPSVNLLLESAAGNYRDRCIAVVLTGTGSDGAAGVEAVKEVGGTVIVEDAETAEFGGMPQAAIATGCVDFVLPLEEIGPAVVALVTQRSSQ
jgi:two-component system chemotaxis response regulator CheB